MEVQNCGGTALSRDLRLEVTPIGDHSTCQFLFLKHEAMQLLPCLLPGLEARD